MAEIQQSARPNLQPRQYRVSALCRCFVMPVHVCGQSRLFARGILHQTRGAHGRESASQGFAECECSPSPQTLRSLRRFHEDHYSMSQRYRVGDTVRVHFVRTMRFPKYGDRLFHSVDRSELSDPFDRRSSRQSDLSSAVGPEKYLACRKQQCSFQVKVAVLSTAG